MFNRLHAPVARPLSAIFFIQLLLILVIGLLVIIGLNFEIVGDFWFAILLGSLGATVSLMRKIQTGDALFIADEKEVKLLSILMPILYGTIMTSIAYLLFMSGILSGDGGNGLITSNVFPNFFNGNLNASSSSDSVIASQFSDVHPDGITNTGKLLVWCFITGYSEKFITGILSKVEGNSGIAEK